jgi:hypothetical protein
MANRFKTFAAMAAATLCIAASAVAQAPKEGYWKGIGIQTNPQGVEMTWKIRMTVREIGDSAIEYPDLKCKGVLQRVANGHDGFEFNEKITSGDCITGGRIVVRERSGRMSWFWYRPGINGPDASAVLYRDEMIS